MEYAMDEIQMNFMNLATDLIVTVLERLALRTLNELVAMKIIVLIVRI